MVTRLGDICEIVSGTTPKSNVPDYWDGDINWITPAELNDDTIIIYESQRKITEQAVKDSSLKSFPAGTVILSSRAPIGKVAIAGVEMYCNQGFKNLICSEKIHNKYLFWFLKGRTDFLNSLGRGATFKEISKSIVENIEIPLPSIEKQKNFAANLDKLNDLISLRKQQLAKLDELVKAQFVEMFGDPVQNPMKWETLLLSKCLSSIENGKSFVCKSEPREGNWPAVLKLSSATYGVFKPEENKAVLDASEFVREAEVHPHDLLFTRKNTPELVGMSAYVFDTAPNLMMPDLIFRLNTNESCNKIFLWQLINHDLFRAEISELASGSAKSMSNISKERLANLKIICPPSELQQRFSKYVEQVHQQKLTVQQSLDKLEVLKKSLMQEYFG